MPAAPDIARPPRRRASTRFAVVGAAVAAVVASLLTPTAMASAATPPDGLSAETAAASCWEIKQNNASAPDGVYWLLTPALITPQQFYCDQTTDGGGWVLIARGRDGWKGQYNGLRSAASIRNTPTGTAAFPVAQLPAKTVDALLNNGRVDALPDGIRLHRATNAAGTEWQEARFKFSSRDRWVWTFGAEHRVSTFNFGGSAGTGGQTSNFGLDQNYRRLDTTAPSSHGYVGGMAFGTGVKGTSAADSYLYTPTTGQGSARPFTQMFLRPQLRSSELTYPAIPDEGSAAITNTPLPESDAIRTVWGVSGTANGVDNELNTEVQAFAQIGDTVYVGGNFRYVQRSENATGADKIEQRFLAAFDVNTGEWKSEFRPVLNNNVKALIGLPDGRLAVGGTFSTVNGESRPAVVILDPTTGATSTGWQVGVENRTTGGVASVRGFSLHGDQLYVSGSFTHWTRPTGQSASAWNGARVNVTTGVPDASWNPLLNGTSVGVEASQAGDRTYFSGYFKQSGSVFTPSATAVLTTPGVPAPLATPTWLPQFSKPGTNYAGNIWQLGIAEAAGRVWVGGSEHSLFAYDRTTFERQTGFITKSGGDFQAVEANGGLVFAGCHCGDWVYSNAYTWDNVGSAWTQADKMNLFGAWDAATGAYLQEFSPIVQARRGFGAWALFQDSTGTLWAGGDLSRSVRAGEVNQWSGGFIRFAARDTQAPTTPGDATLTASGSGVVLNWSASTDDRGVTAYEILRNDRVIGTTTSRTFTVSTAAEGDRFFVRAADAAGNRSASTAKLELPETPPAQVTLIEAGSTWSWRYSSDAWPAGWNTREFDASGWTTGAAPLGFGWSGNATDISVGAPSPKPLSAQFVKSVEVADASILQDASVTLRVDDGAVVYVNGVEVGRANMPTGTLTQNSYATAAPTAAAATANPVTFAVPSSLLVDGVNQVAVSTHLNYRSTPSVSFDLTFTATEGEPGTEPTAPDDPEVIDPEQPTEPEEPTEPETPATETLVPVDATWHWNYDGSAWGADWNTTDVDVTGWASGAAPLGWGSSAIATDIAAAAPSPKPLSARFVTEFTANDVAGITTATVTVRADDGVVVYLNGTELGRQNLPTGTLTQNSYATVAPSSTTAGANKVVFTVPVSLLLDGRNVITASTHLNYRSTPNVSFDLTLDAQRG